MAGRTVVAHQMHTERIGMTLEILAAMARHGLLSGQLGPYENPDTERRVNPRTDPERIAEAWEFLSWLEKLAQQRDES